MYSTVKYNWNAARTAQPRCVLEMLEWGCEMLYLLLFVILVVCCMRTEYTLRIDTGAVVLIALDLGREQPTDYFESDPRTYTVQ
jgi:hypothetical protein